MNKSSKPAKWVCIRFVTSNFSTKGAAILCVHVFARERVRACTASCSIVKHVHTPIVGRRLCLSKLCVPYRRGRISTYGFPLARWRSPGHFYRVLFDHFLVLSFSFIAFSLSPSLSFSLPRLCLLPNGQPRPAVRSKYDFRLAAYWRNASTV